MSSASQRWTFALALTLTACGPQGPDSGMTGTTGGATTGPGGTSGTSGESPTGGESATSGASTGVMPGSTSGTTAANSTGAESSTGDGILPCESAAPCEENEHCTPEARQNAQVAGGTPFGAFEGTFAFASAMLAVDDLGTLYIVPEYATDICMAVPQLRLGLGYAKGSDYMIEAPIELDDGQGQIAQAMAVVHVTNCCHILWFCECKNPSPYEVEFTVVGGAWSLVGKARPNCCRSYSVDENA